MKTHSLIAASQRGFSLLTGFILVIIMFGSLAFFLAGQGINAGFGGTYTNTAKVSGLLTSAGYINTGFDAVTLGGTAAVNVTFDTATTTGIFNPTTGGAMAQEIDPALLDSALVPPLAASTIYGYWVYRKNALTLSGVGVPANPDFTMMVAGLKLGICQQINTTLHGTDITATPPTIASADIAVVGALAGPPTEAIPTNSINPLAVTTTWMNGCYKTSDNHYVYIHTLLAQ